MRQQPAYPRNQRQAVAIAFVEAWAWLEAQGLIVPAPHQRPESGYRVLSRRAKALHERGGICSLCVRANAAARRAPPKDCRNSLDGPSHVPLPKDRHGSHCHPVSPIGT